MKLKHSASVVRIVLVTLLVLTAGVAISHVAAAETTSDATASSEDAETVQMNGTVSYEWSPDTNTDFIVEVTIPGDEVTARGNVRVKYGFSNITVSSTQNLDYDVNENYGIIQEKGQPVKLRFEATLDPAYHEWEHRHETWASFDPDNQITITDAGAPTDAEVTGSFSYETVDGVARSDQVVLGDIDVARQDFEDGSITVVTPNALSTPSASDVLSTLAEARRDHDVDRVEADILGFAAPLSDSDSPGDWGKNRFVVDADDSSLAGDSVWEDLYLEVMDHNPEHSQMNVTYEWDPVEDGGNILVNVTIPEKYAETGGTYSIPWDVESHTVQYMSNNVDYDDDGESLEIVGVFEITDGTMPAEFGYRVALNDDKSGDDTSLPEYNGDYATFERDDIIEINNVGKRL